jgi:demethylmenaquinone methyltransferase/2-methoxy-6-polyprenyl-1,4-benzoquinol methylase
MFSEISGRYDIGNDILSFGTHRLWKRQLVRYAEAPRGGRVLDLATGTGDIALLFVEAVGVNGEVIGSDFCADMIELARRRPKNNRMNLRFEVGDAMALPYANDSFDVTSISFGIRNVDSPRGALAEMRRVTKPGGRVVVLEFGQPSGLFGRLYGFYSNNILPVIGGIVSGNREAYSYLNRTAAQFPCGEAFIILMKDAGFRKAAYKPLFGGVAFLYIGEVEKTEVEREESKVESRRSKVDAPQSNIEHRTSNMEH